MEDKSTASDTCKLNTQAAPADDTIVPGISAQDALNLLQEWTRRVGELADQLQEPRYMTTALRKDLASGILETTNCMFDLLELLIK